jgi:hopanoid biosynthesis associated RND transporter like protein HpnN
VLCAATTSVGFLAFVPTQFIGLSELGITAFGGIVAMLFLSLTLMPALIGVAMTPEACRKLAQRGPAPPLRVPRPRPGAVIITAVLLGLGSLVLIPRVDLDTNVISFRNQRMESVAVFKELLDSRETTPWYLDALVPSLAQADELALRMDALPEVDEVVTLSDFVPEDQEEKLELLQDVSLTLGLPRSVVRQRASPEAQLAALEALRDFLATDPVGRNTLLSTSVERLRLALSQFIDSAEAAGTPQSVVLLADLILDPLPAQLQRLSENLEVGAIAQDDLPRTLVSRMRSPDGHARIQVYPAGDLWDHAVMVDFVESIRPIWGEITGLPVNLVESARATWTSLRQALAWATLAITLLLLMLWRSLSRTALVLGPLLLAVLLTQVATVPLPLSFNFVNVIVLPLLLGIGVDSGIHLVEQAGESGASSASLLESTTARAVLFSALTTIASFGTLMISGHRGIQSLGALLVVGMVFTVAANLILLPALLSWRDKRATRAR